MSFGQLLIVIGLVLVALDYILWRSGPGPRRGPAYHTWGLLHLGIIFIGLGVLWGGGTTALIHSN